MKLKLKPREWEQFEFVFPDENFTQEEIANMDRERAERILKSCISVNELFHLFEIEVNGKEL